jgi:3-methyladenine DNA glycosylase AlkD
MDVSAERQHLLEEIRELAEPEHRAGMMRVTSTRFRVYGVRVPELREIARTWQRAHKQIGRAGLLALLDALWDGESREEQLLVIYLLGHYKRWIPDLTRAQFDRWRRDVDNWEVSDGLAQWVLAPWILADPDARLSYLWDLIDDEDVWSRRLALVTTVGLNRSRKDVAFPDLSLALVDRVKAERHPMITKAVSWALRGLIKTHPDRVAAYLEENRATLAAHAVREVTNKLRTGLKSGKVDE